MVYKENNKSIPASCKNHSCLGILANVVEKRLLKEENFDYVDGLRRNIQGIETYLKLYNLQGVVPTFSHQIKRHLKEIDSYFENGIWKRIYSDKTCPKTL
jgi:hypothetical protein